MSNKNTVLTLALTALLFLSYSAHASLSLFVAPDGNNHWSGRKARRVRNSLNGPLSSLEGARDVLRAMRLHGELPAGGVTIWIEKGSYPFHHTFELTSQDSGSKHSPITYSAWKKQRVVLTGGRSIGGWKKLADNSILQRLSPSARTHVLVCSLKSAGIMDYGDLSKIGFGLPLAPAPDELFFQGKPMTLSRWPLQGYALISQVPKGPRGHEFTYTGDEPARWADDEDVWLHGFWTYNWADSYEKVAKVLPDQRLILTAPPTNAYGYKPGARWYALNILEELNSPGEYYIDRANGLLYFWPPSRIQRGDTALSLLSKPMITLQDDSYITFKGLIVEDSRGSGIQITGGEHNLISHSTLKNLGEYAASIDDDNLTLAKPEKRGTQNGMDACEIEYTGCGGVILDGGNRVTLNPGGNFVKNSIIHDFNRWDFTYHPGIEIDGVGNIIAHNEIYNAPHNAILLGGNNHLIEYNNIHDVCLDVGDAGAIYMGRNLTMRGNIIRFNYLHNIQPLLLAQGGYEGVQSVYLDDCFCGVTIYGNIFYKAGCGVMIGGGRDNLVENNIFVDCSPSIHVDARGISWASFWFNGKDATLMDGLNAVHYNQPPYSAAYPHLADILSDNPAFPKYNTISHNISFGGSWINWNDGLSDKAVTVKDNLVGQDPDFANLKKQDFHLLPGSPAWKLGFKRIPIEKIGPGK